MELGAMLPRGGVVEEPRELGPVLVAGLARGAVAGLFPGAFLSFVLATFSDPSVARLDFLLLIVFAVGAGAALGAGNELAYEAKGTGEELLWRCAGCAVAPFAGAIPAFGLALASEGRTFLDEWPLMNGVAVVGLVVGLAAPALFWGFLGGITLSGLLAVTEIGTPGRSRAARAATPACFALIFCAASVLTVRLAECLAFAAVAVAASGLLWIGLELGERAAKIVEEKLG
jgi:hypothetical protein